MQIGKGDNKMSLMTIDEIPHEETKQREGQETSHYDSQFNQTVNYFDHQNNAGQSAFQQDSQDNEAYYQENKGIQDGVDQMLINDESSIYDDAQIKFTRLEAQNIVDTLDELNIMKRGFKKIFKHLGGLQSSIQILPDKMGQTFEHMKAVLDRRYQSMLKAFINAQSKIKEFTIKLRNMENKIGMNSFLKNLQKECGVYREFSELLTKDMERLTIEIKKEEKRLNAIHSLYEIRKENLSQLNDQNLYLSGVITRLQKHISRHHKLKTIDGQPPRYTHFYAKNADDVEKIERICGASKVKTFRSSNQNYKNNSHYESQQSLNQRQQMNIQTDLKHETDAFKNQFQQNKSSLHSNDFSKKFQTTTSFAKQTQDSENLRLDFQMRQTAFPKPSTSDNEILGSTTMTFKRQKAPQVRIVNPIQTNDQFFFHQNNSQLKQTFLSKTDQLFMKKPANWNTFSQTTTHAQPQFTPINQQTSKQKNYIVLNEQSIYENKVAIEFNLPESMISHNQAKKLTTHRLEEVKPIQNEQIKNENEIVKQQKNEIISNQYSLNENQMKSQSQLINEYSLYREAEQEDQQVQQNQEDEKFEKLQEQDYIKLIEEVDYQTHLMKGQNEKLKINMINHCNQFYNKFALLKSCLNAYKIYLEKNQKIAGSKEGLHGSLLFEMSKLKQVQSQPVLHAFNKQSYKPSYIMDREYRMVVHDTLKGMLDKQISEKQKKIAEEKKIEKKLFLNFTPIQLIGMMALNPSSFDDVQFIMERKARMVQEKIAHSKVLSQSLYSLVKNQ